MSDDNPIKRWTAKRKAAVVMDIFKGKTMFAEVARQYDLTVSEVEGWIDEAQRRMENGFKARSKDIRELYESELRETKEALGEAHLQIYALKTQEFTTPYTPEQNGLVERFFRSLKEPGKTYEKSRPRECQQGTSHPARLSSVSA